MKTCKKCNESKLLSEFYKKKTCSDGYSWSCKPCYIASVIKFQNDNRERFRDEQNARAKTPKYLARFRRESKEYRLRNPAKCKAHDTLNSAIRSGRINSQPCEVCGDTYHINGHHCDYSKPLDVKWLCAIHHSAWHAEHGEGLNG